MVYMHWHILSVVVQGLRLDVYCYSGIYICFLFSFPSGKKREGAR